MPRDLMKKIQEQKEELGLMVDLTSRTHYYGPEVSVGLAVREAKLCDIHMPLPWQCQWGHAGGLSCVWGSVMGQQAGILPCRLCECKAYAGS